MNIYARQGDVPLFSVQELPKNLKVVPRDSRNRVVLALGEAHGHAHALHGAGAQVLESDTGDRFLQIMQSAFVELQPKSAEEIEECGERFTRIMDASGLTFRFNNTDTRLATVLESLGATVTLPGETLQHEEHDAFVIAPGFYALPGQLEYEAPEIVRAVTD